MPGGGTGQTCDGHRRVEGPLRRGPQHQLGPAAGRRRGAGDPRYQGIEDPCQSMYCRTARDAGHRALYAFRYRQLQRKDSPVVQRYRLYDLRCGSGIRCGFLLSRHHRLLGSDGVSEDRGRSPRLARQTPGTDRRGNSEMGGRTGRDHHGQDEFPGRSGDHQGPVSSLLCGSAGVFKCARPMLPAAGCCGNERKHQRRQYRRPLFGA